MKRVYFARRADGTGPIKIGCADWPPKRIKELQGKLREPLALLGYAVGGFVEEARLHRQFSDHCVSREWFEPTDDLLALVEHVRAKRRLPPPPADDRAVVIVRLRQANVPFFEIAERFGISRQRAGQIYRKAIGPDGARTTQATNADCSPSLCRVSPIDWALA